MKQNKLANRTTLVYRLWCSALLGLSVIAVAMAVGMIGYVYFGNMRIDQAFANAAMILSGMGPLDKLETSAGLYFEGVYALVSGLVFFAVAGLMFSPVLHRILHSFHIEDQKPD